MSAFLLIHKNDLGQSVNVPFVYKDGGMMQAVEDIADYIVGAAQVDSFWETVAAERLGVILKLRQQVRELEEQSKAAHDLWLPVVEASR